MPRPDPALLRQCERVSEPPPAGPPAAPPHAPEPAPLAVRLADGLAGTLRRLRPSPAPAARVVAGTQRVVERYGPGRRQSAEWWVPPPAVTAGSGPLPTVVLVHGGYWRRRYDRRLEHAVAADLAARGLLVWNLEYAPSDQPWPRTLTDVALGYDALATGRFAGRVDPRRVVVAGHSAGGHLALWLASRHRLPAGSPGALDPAPAAPRPVLAAPRPVLAVAQAPVADLADGSRRGLGGGAVDALLGGTPDQVPDRYRAADPVALLPTGVRTVLVHGEDDDVVPIDQSERYVRAAQAAGDESVLVRVAGGHMVHLDPASSALQALRDAVRALSA